MTRFENPRNGMSLALLEDKGNSVNTRFIGLGALILCFSTSSYGWGLLGGDENEVTLNEAIGTALGRALYDVDTRHEPQASYVKPSMARGIAVLNAMEEILPELKILVAISKKQIRYSNGETITVDSIPDEFFAAGNVELPSDVDEETMESDPEFGEIMFEKSETFRETMAEIRKIAEAAKAVRLRKTVRIIDPEFGTWGKVIQWDRVVEAIDQITGQEPATTKDGEWI